MANSTQMVRHEMSRGDGTSNLGIFLAAFFVFLVIALIAQMLGWQWRSWLPGAEGVKSMTGGVKAAVYTLMSQLI